MRGLLLLSLVCVVGCASGNQGASRPDVVETVRISGSGGAGQVSTTSSTATNVATVPFPLESVWRVLPAVYDSLGIRISAPDAASHTVGNTGFKIRRQLGDVALSKYINCGNAQGPPSADTYEVQMSVTTQLQPSPSGGTTLMTNVVSSARPIVISGEYANCSSRGTLEAKVVEGVKARLKR